MVALQFVEPQPRAVVHLDVLDRALFDLDFDVGEEGHEIELVQRLVVVLHEAVALGRTLVVVEGDAGRDDIDHAQPPVGNGGLENRLELALVAGERARHEGRADLDRLDAAIHRLQLIHHAAFRFRAGIRGRRELALGQPVDAVVLDDVNQRDVAAQHVDELADADRDRIAVAGDDDAQQIFVGQHGAGGDGRRAPVHAVEAVRHAEEIGGRLGRAADAGELGHAPGLDAHLEEAFDQPLGDGVVAAAGAQRGLRAAIADDLQAHAIGLLGRRRLGGAHRASWWISSSVTVRASSGRPP